MKINELAERLGGTCAGDGEIELTGIGSLERAGPNDLSFVDGPGRDDAVLETRAGCLIVPEEFETEPPTALIRVRHPKLAFARAAAWLLAETGPATGIHPTALVAPGARLGQNVTAGPYSRIGDGAEIGDGTVIAAGVGIGDGTQIGRNCRIHPNTVVGEDCRIGDRVVLHAGVVIGADGFGYVRDPETGEHVKFPQIGAVVIEDDVEIGANSCIDRGALGETRIGAGTKIDNLVQVAHNVSIGKRVVIAAQTGISGSVTIEDDCLIAGQVGFADHTVIRKGSVIGAKSAVFPGKIVRTGAWSGIPVMPMEDYKRLNAHIRSLPRMAEELKDLKKRFENTE